MLDVKIGESDQEFLVPHQFSFEFLILQTLLDLHLIQL